jgi:hypothetical protein
VLVTYVWTTLYLVGVRLKSNFVLNLSSVYHSMARPQVADGGDGLQIWRLAANILNKQSRSAGKGRNID